MPNKMKERIKTYILASFRDTEAKEEGIRMLEGRAYSDDDLRFLSRSFERANIIDQQRILEIVTVATEKVYPEAHASNLTARDVASRIASAVQTAALAKDLHFATEEDLRDEIINSLSLVCDEYYRITRVGPTEE